MKFIDYFIKAKNFFIAIISITALQSLAKLFAIYPSMPFDLIGLIKIFAVFYAGCKLNLGFKNSLILGVLLFLSIIWYVPIALPGIVLISGELIVLSSILITAAANSIIYAVAAMLGNLSAKLISKYIKKKKIKI
jgi:uncharacterized phage infection (PIP) family protein YhgE